MMRSDDLPALFDTAILAGWWAESPPIRFSFGGSDLRNVVLTGPHGINFAVYERLSPPFTAFPLGPISQGFNSMRMVASRPTAHGVVPVQQGTAVPIAGWGQVDPFAVADPDGNLTEFVDAR
jgi:hypothetical protein